jgi:integrase/recombinase XerD
MSEISVGKLLKGNFNVIQEFESYLLNETAVAESSIKKYVGDVKRFSEYLPTIGGDIKNITRTDVQSYITQMEKDKKSAATVDRNFRSIKRFGGFMGISDITFKDLRKSKKPQLRDGEIKSMDEKTVKSLFRIAEQTRDLRTIAVVNVLYYTGVRIKELVNIDIEDMDFRRNGSLKVVGKGNKERKVPLSKEVKLHVKNYLEERGNITEGPLFPSRESNRMTTKTVERILNKLEALYNLNKKEEDQLHLHAHMYRHTCAKRLLEIGFDITQVAQIMGHSSIEVTARYAKKSVEESANLIDLM